MRQANAAVTARKPDAGRPARSVAAAAQGGVQSAPGLRVLVVAHAHPALSVGGGELAAWRLYQAVKAAPGMTAWFVACGGPHVPGHGPAFQMPFGADEFIYRADGFDSFTHFNHTSGLAEAWQALLERLAPDVIHLHHTVNLGVEALLVARRTLPDVRIILTLHDFSAICHNYGQMVTRPHRVLCAQANPTACHACFAERPADDFLVRRRVLQRFLKLADAFVAPSRFTADRYAEWGLKRAAISVIDNITPPAPPHSVRVAEQLLARPGAAAGRGLRCGYFGQLTPFKGLGLLLEAARLLTLRGAPPVHIEIHGDDANHVAEFRAEIRGLLAAAPANVTFHGRYPNERVHALMRGVDVVVVPSVWWENAPTVIEEALHAGRPVICGDVGGMAEKVRDGIDGLHFMAGSSTSLADVIEVLARDPELLARLAAGLRRPAEPQAVLEQHLALYRPPA
jgi:glycosyltransferase involved in cell wall biosynthesis